MRGLVLYIFVGITFLSCKSTTSLKSKSNTLLIKNGVLLSPTTHTMGKVGYIHIINDKIAYVGEEPPKLNDFPQVLDAKGKYIIPGLIDAHVHITNVNGLLESDEIENPALVKVFQEQLPKSYLYFGFTTLVDLGTTDLQRLRDFKKQKIRPNLFYVGGAAVIGKGYGLTNWEDAHPNFIYQKDDYYKIPNNFTKRDHTPKKVVGRISKSGAIAVKSYYEPGFDPSQAPFPVPSLELANELKKASHNKGMPLVMHGNSLQAHAFLAEAEVDMVAHGIWKWKLEEDLQKNVLPEAVVRVLDKEIDLGIGYMPTLQVMRGLQVLTDAHFLQDPELRNVLPEPILIFYRDNYDVMYNRVFGDAPKEIIRKSFETYVANGQSALNYLSKNQGNILFGTDTPSSPTYGNPPGYNGFLEIKQMYTAGVDLYDILKSATIANAVAFGIEEQFGSIEKGKVADLIILNDNPLINVDAYNAIDKIIKSGIVYPRAEFQANN